MSKLRERLPGGGAYPIRRTSKDSCTRRWNARERPVDLTAAPLVNLQGTACRGSDYSNPLRAQGTPEPNLAGCGPGPWLTLLFSRPPVLQPVGRAQMEDPPKRRRDARRL